MFCTRSPRVSLEWAESSGRRRMSGLICSTNGVGSVLTIRFICISSPWILLSTTAEASANASFCAVNLLRSASAAVAEFLRSSSDVSRRFSSLLRSFCVSARMDFSRRQSLFSLEVRTCLYPISSRLVGCSSVPGGGLVGARPLLLSSSLMSSSVTASARTTPSRSQSRRVEEQVRFVLRDLLRVRSVHLLLLCS